MTNKIKSAQEFLRSLEEPNITMGVMKDRLDKQVLGLMSSYAEMIFSVKDKTQIKDKELITCSMIIGYLLKSHIDRFELEETLNTNISL